MACDSTSSTNYLVNEGPQRRETSLASLKYRRRNKTRTRRVLSRDTLCCRTLSLATLLSLAGCFLFPVSYGLINPTLTRRVTKYRTSFFQATETKIEIPTTTKTDRKLKKSGKNNNKHRTQPLGRPQVTVRPGPGVTITNTCENTIVMLDTDESNKKESKGTGDEVSESSGKNTARAENENSPSSSQPSEKKDFENFNRNKNGDAIDNDDSKLSQRAAVATAALLRRNRGAGISGRSSAAAARKKKGTRTTTSVGARRVKSASTARQKGGSVTSSILGTVKTVAAAAAAAAGPSSQIQAGNKTKNVNKTTTATTRTKSKKEMSSSSKKKSKKNGNNSQKRPSKTVIDAVIKDTLEGQISAKKKTDQSIGGGSMSMGILGEPVDIGPQHHILQEPLPGSILLHPTMKRSSDKLQSGSMTVRVATEADDVDIANLRLSVFSDFAPEVRAHFCNRSCQVLSNRRLQGATCLVATVPMTTKMIGDDFVLGSAECSVHEFYGTQLGMSRLPESVLYITEVAVNPCARQIGVGRKLLEGVDELASIRGVETLYLHVDVTNFAALRLYERAGYQQVDSQDPIFGEFTTKLNLHDGATKGRNHYLLYKDLTPYPTWINAAVEQQKESQHSNCFGFDLQ